MSKPQKIDPLMYPLCPGCFEPCSIEEASCPGCGTQVEDPRHAKALEEIFSGLEQAGYRNISGGRA